VKDSDLHLASSTLHPSSITSDESLVTYTSCSSHGGPPASMHGTAVSKAEGRLTSAREAAMAGFMKPKDGFIGEDVSCCGGGAV
jgi:hypothetical protein